jgi:hypothetical protein
MPNHSPDDRSENQHHLIGWILFVLCALCFLASSLQNRDLLACIGSLLFLIACGFFIVPLVKKMER